MNRILEILNEKIIQYEEAIKCLEDRIEYLEEQNTKWYNEVNRLKAKKVDKE